MRHVPRSVDFVDGYSVRSGHQAEPRHLSPEDRDALLEEAQRHPYELAIALGCLAGARRSEILLARLDDVDLKGGRLRLHGTKGKRDRTVPITPKLEAVIRRRRPIANPLVRLPKSPESTYKVLRALCRRAGVSPITWHTLRHTYATQLVRGGVQLHEVQKLMGHASLATTGKYLHANPDGVRDAVAAALG